jgi:hypothetical protein
MEQRTSTFGVNPESNGMDFRAARAFATCCGVNLAFAAWGVWFFMTTKVYCHATRGFFSRKLKNAWLFKMEQGEYFWR